MSKMVYSLSRYEFNNLIKKKEINEQTVEDKINDFFICIHDTEKGDFNIPVFKKDHKNVLRMWFDNVDKDVVVEGKVVKKTITFSQVDRLVEFIMKAAKHPSYNIIIHCAAGKERSGAVAQFIIQDILEEEHKMMSISNNKHIQPNKRILNLLRKNYEKRINLPQDTSSHGGVVQV